VRTFLSVCAAGAAGTGARYLVNAGCARWIHAQVPIGTFTVNAVGSFLIGLAMEVALRGGLSPATRLVLVTGFLGGFTTYSAFNHEVLSEVERGAWLFAAVYAAATLVTCFATGAAGMWLGRSIPLG
jgi:CrcB protein